ncbi:DUF1489 domain-containing protein [uncultured Roseovarius sp.]|uniref:DUF1489 family protein n=1 Tax=uncultured Roseovarius sp. TaxID=293344 RepID=UPI002633F7CA|nr:DUF1489 domain-containing protein [uncultured Roseovarius sp.]
MMHLLKLSVGTESVDGLAKWHKTKRSQGPDGLPRHVTRMWPKREAEVLDGGSIFWVIQGFILCRQRVLRFDEVIGSDGIRRCAFVLNPELVRTTSVKRRPFQGWRYLDPGDAPVDLPQTRSSDDALPDDLSAALADIGVL